MRNFFRHLKRGQEDIYLWQHWKAINLPWKERIEFALTIQMQNRLLIGVNSFLRLAIKIFKLPLNGFYAQSSYQLIHHYNFSFFAALRFNVANWSSDIVQLLLSPLTMLRWRLYKCDVEKWDQRHNSVWWPDCITFTFF